MEELAALTPGRSGADIEAICRRASLLALREWIAPKLQMPRVQVTEAKDDEDTPNNQETGTGTGAGAEAGEIGSTGTQTGEIGSTSAGENGSTGPALPGTHFQIRPEHFAQAIDEQRERYSVQEEANAARKRQEAGRQRLIEMAAGQDTKEKRPLRGFRLWLARLFGLVSY
jgi:transitional endoplasmic reticulum ATPase